MVVHNKLLHTLLRWLLAALMEWSEAPLPPAAALGDAIFAALVPAPAANAGDNVPLARFHLELRGAAHGAAQELRNHMSVCYDSVTGLYNAALLCGLAPDEGHFPSVAEEVRKACKACKAAAGTAAVTKARNEVLAASVADMHAKVSAALLDKIDATWRALRPSAAPLRFFRQSPSASWGRGRAPLPRRYNAQFAISATLCERVKKICDNFSGGGGGDIGGGSGGSGAGGSGGSGRSSGMDALLQGVSLLQDEAVFKRELEVRLLGLEAQYKQLLFDLEMLRIAVPDDLKAGAGDGGGGGGGGAGRRGGPRGLNGASAIYRKICGTRSQPAAVVAPGLLGAKRYKVALKNLSREELQASSVGGFYYKAPC